MKKALTGFCAVLFCLVQASAEPQQADVLGAAKVAVPEANAADLVERATHDVKKLIGNFRMVLDKGTKITTPPTLGGTIDHPVYKVGVRKCVLFVCQTVDLDIEFSLQKVSGTCDHNWVLNGNLERSGEAVSDSYSDIQISVCLKKNPANLAPGVHLDISGLAVRTPDFDASSVQSQVLKMLKLQLPAIVQAVQTTLGIKTAVQR